jgi:hypothetical protein
MLPVSMHCGGTPVAVFVLTAPVGDFSLQLYEDVWSQGRVLLLDSIMAEEHQQLDRVWQATAGGGRRRMKRGVLAYRAAYPDIK